MPTMAGVLAPYTVVTNHHRLPEVDGWETTAEERADLDYVDWAAVEAGSASFTGVRYRGNLYDLGDTEGSPPKILSDLGWHKWVTDSYFSATVFAQVKIDGEWYVIAGRVYV